MTDKLGPLRLAVSNQHSVMKIEDPRIYMFYFHYKMLIAKC